MDFIPVIKFSPLSWIFENLQKPCYILVRVTSRRILVNKILQCCAKSLWALETIANF